MNKTWKCALIIGGKVYVAWKRIMLHDVTLQDLIGGHQAYIKNILFMGHRIFQLAKTTQGWQAARALGINTEIYKQINK